MNVEWKEQEKKLGSNYHSQDCGSLEINSWKKWLQSLCLGGHRADGTEPLGSTAQKGHGVLRRRVWGCGPPNSMPRYEKKLESGFCCRMELTGTGTQEAVFFFPVLPSNETKCQEGLEAAVGGPQPHITEQNIKPGGARGQEAKPGPLP